MKILTAIQEAGLEELAKTSIAYETMMGIENNGVDIKNPWPGDSEMEKLHDDDTAETIRMLSNPMNWGISDFRWMLFCEEYQV